MVTVKNICFVFVFIMHLVCHIYMSVDFGVRPGSRDILPNMRLAPRLLVLETVCDYYSVRVRIATSGIQGNVRTKKRKSCT